MADDSGSSALLGVIVGILIVAALLFFVFGGFPNTGGGGPDVDVSVDAPSVPSPAPGG